MANATPERLRALTAANLDALEAILHWNVRHGIDVFRITSNLVPFASHAANRLAWWDEHRVRFEELGALIRGNRLRLSTHPGQYTVLGSPRAAVVDASVAELEYQSRLLDSFGLDTSHRMVVHLAGTRERFAAGVARLSARARARLTLENDERRSFAEVLDVAGALGLPVVFDVFHHELNPSLDGLGTRELVLRAAATWRPEDGRAEVHFSTQEPNRRPGAHAETLDVEAFARFAGAVVDLPVDCIVEVKDKERSALRALAVLQRVAA